MTDNPNNADQVNDGGEPAADETVKFAYDGGELDIPKQFYDEEKKGARLDAMVKSLKDLRQQVTNKPKAPDNYDLKLSDDLKDITIDPQNPHTQEGLKIAKELGISQDGFSKLLNLHAKIVAGSAHTPDDFFEGQKEVFKRTFGNDYQKEVDASKVWLAGIMGDKAKRSDVAEEIESLVMTAAGVELLKEVQKAMGEKNVPSAKDHGGVPSLTDADLRKIMMSDEYRRNDPITIARVKEGFERLYPNDK